MAALAAASRDSGRRSASAILSTALAFGIVMRLYLTHDVWERVANTTVVHNLEAAENVTGRGELAGAWARALPTASMSAEYERRWIRLTRRLAVYRDGTSSRKRAVTLRFAEQLQIIEDGTVDCGLAV